MPAPEGGPGSRPWRCVTLARPPARVRARRRRLTPASLTPRSHDLQLVELVWIQRDHSRFFPPDQTNATGSEAVTVAGAGAGSERVLVLLPALPAHTQSGFLTSKKLF